MVSAEERQWGSGTPDKPRGRVNRQRWCRVLPQNTLSWRSRPYKPALPPWPALSPSTLRALPSCPGQVSPLPSSFKEVGKGKERKGRGRKDRRKEGRPAGGQAVRGGLTLLAVEDSQEAEHEGPTGGSEEAPPVVPHREVGGHDLDAEQDAWR